MKKPYHNDVMDEYLASLGLWRKPTAKDGSCLFRAVAEQLFHSQAMYERVRDTCIGYMRRNREKYEKFYDDSFDEHLKRLEEGKEWAGQAEINALSLLYKRDFLVYQDIGSPPNAITHNKFKEKVLLCYSGPNHYDSVYPKIYTVHAGIAQSIVYELLYSSVFLMEKPVEKAREMMCSKPPKHRQPDHHDHCRDIFGDGSDGQEGSSGSPDSSRDKPERKTVPFPFKVAKALCPDHYRNTEYDSWIEGKKDNRDYQLSEQFSPGDKCQLVYDKLQPGRTFNAHIQEMSPDKGPVTVFIEELGEKHKVPFSCLIPVPQPAYDSDLQFSARRRKSRNRKDLQPLFASQQRIPCGTALLSESNGRPAHRYPARSQAIPVQLRTPPRFVTAAANCPRSRWNSSEQRPPRFANECENKTCRSCVEANLVPIRNQRKVKERLSRMIHGIKEKVYNNWIEENGGEQTTTQDDGSGGGGGCGGGGGGVYVPYYPGFTVPHLDNMLGPVNFGVVPSCDPLGQDLPHGDPTSMRFFFNLGLEYYRVHSYMQQASQPQAPQQAPPQGPPPQAPQGPPPPPVSYTPTTFLNSYSSSPTTIVYAGGQGGGPHHSGGGGAGTMVQLPATPPLNDEEALMANMAAAAAAASQQQQQQQCSYSVGYPTMPPPPQPPPPQFQGATMYNPYMFMPPPPPPMQAMNHPPFQQMGAETTVYQLAPPPPPQLVPVSTNLPPPPSPVASLPQSQPAVA